MATTWKWSFHLISKTTQDWKGCEFLLLIYHCSTKQIDFRLQTSLICKKKKTTTCEKWLQGVFCKKAFLKISANSQRNTFLTLLNAFRPSGLQLLYRESPALVFRNQPFVDPLQSRCSWIIHKIHGETPVWEFLFKGALSGLRQFLTTESPLKMMENAFYFTLKALFVLKILSFCLDFLVMYQNGLIKKTRLISNFMTSQPC